jgi:hypothetical protein
MTMRIAIAADERTGDDAGNAAHPAAIEAVR